MKPARTCHGLPWFTKHEKKVFEKRELSAIYGAGPAEGRPVYIGRTGQFPERMTSLKSECNGNFAVHFVAWTDGDLFARRIMREVEAILDQTKRRLAGNLFDLPHELAHQVVLRAAHRAGVQICTHTEMLAKIRAIRQHNLDVAATESSTVERVDWRIGADVEIDKRREKVDDGRTALDLSIFGIS
ncbi:hypothetical protein J4G48_0015820 [Bradyrhizobium barranii subsp. apii]|uniref:hypothetical protein n=1 Tax=Bradyrhizobium barranii TaxID=2992140 RepID=UPI001AA1C320|nr:hypothetical protein [Bradyrhizobium barranii]UPT99423.1 hypothetical protein J4G48_0015820 [Bradyrhizobium barranii subsp. apii]